MATVIVGVGNPVLSDDSVGLKIAAALERRLAGSPGVATAQVCCGGMRLMEAMTGYDRAIVVDAIVSGSPAGTIHRLADGDLPASRWVHSLHDATLPAALEFGRAAGLRLPSEIRIWAIEAADVETFGEALTPAVERSAEVVIAEILKDVTQ